MENEGVLLEFDRLEQLAGIAAIEGDSETFNRLHIEICSMEQSEAYNMAKAQESANQKDEAQIVYRGENDVWNFFPQWQGSWYVSLFMSGKASDMRYIEPQTP